MHDPDKKTGAKSRKKSRTVTPTEFAHRIPREHRRQSPKDFAKKIPATLPDPTLNKDKKRNAAHIEDESIIMYDSLE